MKIKLLHDGGYGGMENVKFPVEVEATDWLGLGFDVPGSELIRVGATAKFWDRTKSYYWPNEEISK